MLRCVCVLFALFQMMSAVSSDTLASARAALAMHSGMLLRLHVVAEDDTAEMQSLKLTVRDAVQSAYADAVGNIPAALPMQQKAAALLPDLRAAAEAALSASDLPVTVTLENVAFDERELDGLRIPAGTYPALMVRIGSASGHNWWGLLDADLALSAAQTSGGLPAYTSGSITWVWSIPAWLANLFGCQDAPAPSSSPTIDPLLPSSVQEELP